MGIIKPDFMIRHYVEDGRTLSDYAYVQAADAHEDGRTLSDNYTHTLEDAVVNSVVESKAEDIAREIVPMIKNQLTSRLEVSDDEDFFVHNLPMFGCTDMLNTRLERLPLDRQVYIATHFILHAAGGAMHWIELRDR